MLIRGSRVKIADNSGGLTAEIFGIPGGTGKKSTGVGGIVRVAVKSVVPNNGKVKKGDVCQALIVRTKYPVKNYDDSFASADENAIVLLNNDLSLKGSRVFGFVSRLAFNNTNDNIKKIQSACEEIY